MHRWILLPLLLIACADDKDPTVCPTTVTCTAVASQDSAPPDTSNGSFSSTDDTDPVLTSSTDGSISATATMPTHPTSEALSESGDPDPTGTLTTSNTTFTST